MSDHRQLEAEEAEERRPATREQQAIQGIAARLEASGLDAMLAREIAQAHPRDLRRGSTAETLRRTLAEHLAPLAALGVSLIGEGDLHCGSEMGSAGEMLRSAGLEPVTLGPKEGITLINGTQAHTAVAALATTDARAIWQTAHVAGAMSLEALLGTPVPFDARIKRMR